MVRRKLTAACVAVAAAVLTAVVPGAFAATPNQIYRDYADNGRIDGAYSQTDLQRALKDATVQGYGHGHGGMKPQIEIRLRCRNGSAAAGTDCGTRGYTGGGGLPFTGLDLAVMVGGAVTLLAFGGGLRRFARQRH